MYFGNNLNSFAVIYEIFNFFENYEFSVGIYRWSRYTALKWIPMFDRIFDENKIELIDK